ncbi:unnamed protein product [Clavelina lepadiformis]|uniref:Uncharacterized protein n=1 Tax=Clavelina lepadiformis TaxID=159417 RepID=A0ABP0GE24_CLALP
MFRRSQRPHKSLLTDSKSVDDEESNVNDEQNLVSHHPNVADGSKEEKQLPVDNKTHLRLKPNRETCVVEVAETSQHVMSEDRRRVHHHQRKKATDNMDQNERRKLKKESPKKQHHDESKIHHRVKHHGKNPVFEVAGTSQFVLSEGNRAHHHQNKETSDELDQKDRFKWVKELFLQKQHHDESKSQLGVKPHGENPANEVADTSRHLLSEDHRVVHHQRKEATDKKDQKQRRKLKKESSKKHHRGESKSHRGVKLHGETPANTVADTSQRVLNEKHQVIHHQNKETSDELDQKDRLKWVKELFLQKQHHDESKSQLGVKPHGENPAIEVADTSQHVMSEDHRVYHHQRKKATDNMDQKKRRKLKKESSKKQRRGESKNLGVKPHGESPANTVADTSQRVLNEKHRVIYHQNKETNAELDQKDRFKWVKELFLQKQDLDESKSELGVKLHGGNPAIEVADNSRHLLSEDGQVHHHQHKEATDNMNQKKRRKLKKESLKKEHRGESKSRRGVKLHGETPANTVADTSQRVLNEKHQVIYHQNKEMNDELDQKERLKWMIELLLHEDHHDENKSHRRVKPHDENPAIEVADTSRHLLSEDHRVYHHQREKATDNMNQKERRKRKIESPKKLYRGESKSHRGVKPHGETPANTVAHTSQRVLNEKHQVHHQNKETSDELDQKDRLKWVKEVFLQKYHHDESKSQLGVKPHGENLAIEVADTSRHLLSEDGQVHHQQRKESTDNMDQKQRRKLKKESPKKLHHDENKIHNKMKLHGKNSAFEVAGTSQRVLNEKHQVHHQQHKESNNELDQKSEEHRVYRHQRKEASDEIDRKPRQKLVKEFPKKQHRGESKSHRGVKPHGEHPAFEVAEYSQYVLGEDRRVYHHQRKEANDKMDKKERRKLKKEFLSKHHRGESDDFCRKSHQTGKRRHKHSIIVTKTARRVSSEGHSKHDAISQPQPSSGRVRFEEKSSNDLKSPMRKIFLSSIVRNKDQPSTSSAAFVTSLSKPPTSPSIAMTSSQETSTSSFVGMTSSQEPSTSSFVGMTSSQEPSTSSQESSTSSFVGMTSSQEPSTSSQEPSTSSQKPSTSSFVAEQVTPSARSHFAGQRVAVSGTGPHRGIAFVENDPNTGDSRVLPHFFIYIAWILLVATVLTSTVLCALYGMSYGIETCKEWLVSVSVAFLQSVIILEPLKEVLIAYVKVVNNPKLDLRDWIPPLPPSVTPRSHSGDCDAIKRRQDEERSKNRIYRPPTQLRVEITLQDIEEKIRTKRKIKVSVME